MLFSGEMLVRSFASYEIASTALYSNSYDKDFILARGKCAILGVRYLNDSLWSSLEVLRGYFDDEFDVLVFNIDISDNDFDNMDGDKWRNMVIAEIDGLF